ncbi:hypothetical protein Q7458_01280 [Glaesserella parasuis]|uniref:Uncharacterized protein n=2 Tax=Glaesserella parasuis TaxID=738 RepID=A0AAJ6ACQ7_GLAPU|nr:hypothetical protein [Glaesserella parasuis]MDG6361809.1 hypothetical protein [Glaesserella parasuis]MDO9764307.1 hypothetical protein [Glaesserella parasuis]MDO9798093.1 hypothetical protein [Glaesserella parasuis]MDO9814861.1 hypothetical protein [Glaesserella parasuis]MDO9850183.1 hypothetical protein [Glaesserella parasuis]
MDTFKETINLILEDEQHIEEQHIEELEEDITPFLLEKRKNLNSDEHLYLYRYQIYFSTYEAVSILFGLNPCDVGNNMFNQDFKSAQTILEQYIESGLLRKSSIEIEHNSELGDVKKVKVHREDLELFADKMGFKIEPFPDIPIFYDDNKKEPEQAQNTHLIDEDITTFTYNPGTLIKFIEDIINPDLLENGKIPSYSKLHTKISLTNRNKSVVSKNTIRKYLSQ